MTLTDQQKKIIEKTATAEISISEIAEIANCEKSQARSWMQRNYLPFRRVKKFDPKESFLDGRVQRINLTPNMETRELFRAIRDIVLKKHGFALTNEDFARIMDVSVSTVESWLSEDKLWGRKMSLQLKKLLILEVSSRLHKIAVNRAAKKCMRKNRSKGNKGK